MKDNVKRILKEYDVHYYMPVPAGYGAPHLDFICCHRGMYIAIETKAPGKKPTPRQKLTIKQVKAAGGKVFVIDGEIGYQELINWLQLMSIV